MYNRAMTTHRAFQNLVDELFQHVEDIEPVAEYAEYDAEAVEYDAAIEAGCYPSELLT